VFGGRQKWLSVFLAHSANLFFHMSEEQKQTAVGKTARIINILLIEDNHDDSFLFQLGARATQATVSHVIDLEAAIAHLTFLI